MINRRDFVKVSGGAAAAAGLSSMGMPAVGAAAEPLYKISLAEWSINKPLFGGQMQHLDFAKIAKGVGIDAIEYVNQFFKDKAKDAAYLAEMNTRAKGEGVTQVLIMCDGEGNLGDSGCREAADGGREPPQVGRGGQGPRLPHHPRQRLQRQGKRRTSSRSWSPTACASSVSSPTSPASTSSSRTTAGCRATRSGWCRR